MASLGASSLSRFSIPASLPAFLPSLPALRLFLCSVCICMNCSFCIAVAGLIFAFIPTPKRHHDARLFLILHDVWKLRAPAEGKPEGGRAGTAAQLRTRSGGSDRSPPPSSKRVSRRRRGQGELQRSRTRDLPPLRRSRRRIVVCRDPGED